MDYLRLLEEELSIFHFRTIDWPQLIQPNRHQLQRNRNLQGLCKKWFMINSSRFLLVVVEIILDTFSLRQNHILFTSSLGESCQIILLILHKSFIEYT